MHFDLSVADLQHVGLSLILQILVPFILFFHFGLLMGPCAENRWNVIFVTVPEHVPTSVLRITNEPFHKTSYN